MRPIVHIGYHKTATTWFQQSYYPLSSSHRWVPRELARRALLDPDGFAFDADDARRILHDPSDPRPPVICEENLSGYLHNGGLHGLMAPEAARRIKAVFPDAIIVIMIRAQPQMLAASYVQYVRGGGTYGARRYLLPDRYVQGASRHRYKAPRFAFEHFEYDRLVAYYDGLFGRQNVIVRTYEALQSDAATFMAELAAAIGLELDIASVPVTVKNKSFGQATILLGRLLGLFTARSVMDKAFLVSIPGFYEVRRITMKAFAAVDPTPSGVAVLPRALIRHAQERYAASNERLAAMRPLNLATLSYPLPTLAPNDIPLDAVIQAGGLPSALIGLIPVLTRAAELVLT